MTHIRNHAGIGILLAALLSGCGKENSSDSQQQQHIKEVVAAGGVVDSILPMDELLRQFRADITDKPDTLRHASSSAKALVERWAKAIAANDASDLNAMLIDRAEFAWLYFPGSRMSLPPYESPPSLLWGQLLSSSEEGARGLLRHYGGKPLVVQELRCPNAPIPEGGNLLHERCVVRMRSDTVDVAESTYFGTIVERDKRFKFLGYANKL